MKIIICTVRFGLSDVFCCISLLELLNDVQFVPFVSGIHGYVTSYTSLVLHISLFVCRLENFLRNGKFQQFHLQN